MSAKPPGIASILSAFAIVGIIIYSIVHTSSVESHYGTVYQITKGFYTGCTGKAVRASSSTITLINVVCIYDSLEIEISIPKDDVVVWQDPSGTPGPYGY